MDWTVRNVVEPRFDLIDRNLKIIMNTLNNLENENIYLKKELQECKNYIQKIENNICLVNYDLNKS